MQRGAVSLIIDPAHEYGTAFIGAVHREFGHRAVCLYTDRAAAQRHRQVLADAGTCVAAAYVLHGLPMGTIAARLADLHPVAAVLPFNETSVLPAAELAYRLGVVWVDPGVIARFRDKHSLKTLVRTTAPHVRVNASLLVRTPDEVACACRAPPFERFVLKPNHGYGNRHIAFFSRASPLADIARYLAATESPTVMEEYIDGDEYFVNGQVDGAGRIVVFAVFRYLRTAANGRPNLDYDTLRIAHGSREFEQLSRYATAVVRATQLHRCPFHLEAKIDRQGPCLIEVAARLPGHGNAWLSGALHGPRLDLIALAGHYYVTPRDCGDPALDWRQYDSQSIRYVHGIGTRRARVRSLSGVLQVEALPEFYGWVKRPELGQRAPLTVDTLTMPWSVILRAATDHLTEAAAQRVRALMQQPAPPVRGFGGALTALAPRAWRRLKRCGWHGGPDAAIDL